MPGIDMPKALSRALQLKFNKFVVIFLNLPLDKSHYISVFTTVLSVIYSIIPLPRKQVMFTQKDLQFSPFSVFFPLETKKAEAEYI